MRKPFILTLLFLCLLAIVSVGVSATMCYQEFSNISTGCGGVANSNAPTWGGSFKTGQEWGYCVDGDWNSICCSTYGGWVDENYTKPSGALNTSVWQIKVINPLNLTIPPSCWNAYPNNLIVRDFVTSDGTGAKLYCYNGTGWVILADYDFFSRCISEDAMWWNISCVPDWSCSGYGNCLSNDTQPCNATIDNNQCGGSYAGNFSEFQPQVCDFCMPNWNCSGYGNCLQNNTQICNTTADLNNCYAQTNLSSDQYTGNFSEFQSQVCDFCVPSWFCSGWGDCLENNTQMCNDATDLNMCGEPYTGDYSELGGRECVECEPSWVCDGYSTECVGGFYACNATDDIYDCGQQYGGSYSEFGGQACGGAPTGYVALFNVSDIPKLTIDTLAGFVLTIIGLMGLIIIVLIIGGTLKAMKK
jgi:hypothetical protein